MMDISVSKLPKGKVLMRHRYHPSSATSVLMMTSDESKMGSPFLKRTRRDHVPNAACTGGEDDEVSNTKSKKIKITSCLKLFVLLSVCATVSHSLSVTHILSLSMGTFQYIVPYITQLSTLTLTILTNHLTLTRT